MCHLTESRLIAKNRTLRYRPLKIRAILAGHCIGSACTIVTLPFPTRIHPSRTTCGAIARMLHNTYIDSPAATAPPKRRSSGQPVGLFNFKYMIRGNFKLVIADKIMQFHSIDYHSLLSIPVSYSRTTKRISIVHFDVHVGLRYTIRLDDASCNFLFPVSSANQHLPQTVSVVSVDI